MIHPLKFNFELEKEFMSESWDKSYIRQNKNFPYNYGCEWECISLNLYMLNA